MQTWAAIFDWDGVVVDSASQHEESWRRLALEEGHTLPDDHFKRGYGMKNQHIIPHLLGWTQDPEEIRRMAVRKEALYRKIVQEIGVRLLPGAGAFLRDLRRAAIPCAVGSSTPKLNITSLLHPLELDGTFSAIIAAEDVRQGKPDPEVFLLAASRLGMQPARCVVFEDTPVGLQAARSAGMKAVAVTTTHPAERLQGADRIVRQLDELHVNEFDGWFAGKPRSTSEVEL